MELGGEEKQDALKTIAKAQDRLRIKKLICDEEWMKNQELEKVGDRLKPADACFLTTPCSFLICA